MVVEPGAANGYSSPRKPGLQLLLRRKSQSMLVSCGCNHERVGEPAIRNSRVSGIFSRQDQTLAELTLFNRPCIKKKVH